MVYTASRYGVIDIYGDVNLTGSVAEYDEISANTVHTYETSAAVQRNTTERANATLTATYRQDMANSLSTALTSFATSNGTPWANYAAATAAVDAAFVTATSTENETLIHARSDARLLETNTVTDAEQTLTVDLVFAEAEKEIVVAGAEKGLAVAEEAANNAASAAGVGEQATYMPGEINTPEEAAQIDGIPTETNTNSIGDLAGLSGSNARLTGDHLTGNEADVGAEAGLSGSSSSDTTSWFVSNNPANEVDSSGLGSPKVLSEQEVRELQEFFGVLDSELDEFLRQHGYIRAFSEPSRPPEPPITVVGGSIFGSSIHLNDSYFDCSPFGIPTVVCHGMTGIGRVGPPNSFRFGAGPGQLQYYQGIRDTTGIAAFIVGAGSTFVTIGPALGITFTLDPFVGTGGTAAFGRLIGWGSGVQGAIARTANITSMELQAAAITAPVAQWWYNFYQRALLNDKGAGTALERLKLMERVLELLGK